MLHFSIAELFHLWGTSEAFNSQILPTNKRLAFYFITLCLQGKTTAKLITEKGDILEYFRDL